MADWFIKIIACQRNESLQSWIEHSQGVATVLELRGRDQLRREGGFWMFQALRNEVVRVIQVSYIKSG